MSVIPREFIMSSEAESVVFVKGLMKKREEMEAELAALQGILESENTNMTEPLVDKDGYPRADIDVYAVRNARVKIIYLKNDLKELMRKIEDGLHHVHADVSAGKLVLSKGENSAAVGGNQTPFLKVGLVARGSPAQLAGLEENDLILRFGTVSFSNFTGLNVIGSIVQHSEGKDLPLTVKRGQDIKDLQLTPKKWTGKGLLGCNVVPIDGQ